MNLIYMIIFHLFVFIVSIFGQSCLWTPCLAWNTPKCAPYYVEKQSGISCGGFFGVFLNQQMLFCCDERKCNYSNECVPVGCPSCSECPDGQISYQEVAPQICQLAVAQFQLLGKKYWCCDP